MRKVLYRICLFNDNQTQTGMSYLYEMERRGKRARCWRDREVERECVQEREGGCRRGSLIVKMTIGTDHAG
jgi:hypothetical protein